MNLETETDASIDLQRGTHSWPGPEAWCDVLCSQGRKRCNRGIDLIAGETTVQGTLKHLWKILFFPPEIAWRFLFVWLFKERTHATTKSTPRLLVIQHLCSSKYKNICAKKFPCTCFGRSSAAQCFFHEYNVFCAPSFSRRGGKNDSFITARNLEFIFNLLHNMGSEITQAQISWKGIN